MKVLRPKSTTRSIFVPESAEKIILSYMYKILHLNYVIFSESRQGAFEKFFTINGAQFLCSVASKNPVRIVKFALMGRHGPFGLRSP